MHMEGNGALGHGVGKAEMFYVASTVGIPPSKNPPCRKKRAFFSPSKN